MYTFQLIDLDDLGQATESNLAKRYPTLPPRFIEVVFDALGFLISDPDGYVTEHGMPQPRLERIASVVDDTVERFLALSRARDQAESAYYDRQALPTSSWLGQAFRWRKYVNAGVDYIEIPPGVTRTNLFAAAALIDADKALVAYTNLAPGSDALSAMMELMLGAAFGVQQANADHFLGFIGRGTPNAEVLQSIRSASARKAAVHRHAITYAIRERATDLYRILIQKNARLSKRQAAKAILEDVTAFASASGQPLSQDRGEQTVYEWLLKADT